MMIGTVNFWPVLVSAVAAMVIGSIWYGPLFGKKYTDLMGMNSWTPEQQAAMKGKMAWSYLGQFIASLVTFYVLAGFIQWTTTPLTAVKGAEVAFWPWLGFVFAMKFGETLWGGKKTLFWLSTGSSLIIFLVGGAIIGGWR